jgi:pimeloyl-ACP methyl ester carboxylesterase
MTNALRMTVVILVTQLFTSQVFAGKNLKTAVPEDRCQDTYGWQIAKATKDPSYQKMKMKVQSSQLVFVSGFLNEIFPKYYKDNILGIQKVFNLNSELIHVIKPSSRRSVESNATWLRTEILSINRKNPAPIILVGHSKGAAESLSMLMAYPELVKEGIVRDLISVQGAIFGSYIADLYSTVPPKNDSIRQGLFSWLLAQADHHARVFDDWVTNKLFDDGIDSLETENSRQRFQRLLQQLSNENRELLNDRVHYVISHIDTRDSGMLTYLSSWYLSVLGLNDGVLMLEDQHSEDLGRVLAHYYADHTDLVIGKDVSNLTQECVTNFTTDLMYRLSTY